MRLLLREAVDDRRLDPGFVVQNPVIAQRSAESVVTIRDQMTLVIGGLWAMSEIHTESGIPILVDIPVLNFFFSKKRKSKVRNELDFFITPRIVSTRLSQAIFAPPGEKERLRKLKSGEGRGSAAPMVRRGKGAARPPRHRPESA